MPPKPPTDRRRLNPQAVPNIAAENEIENELRVELAGLEESGRCRVKHTACIET
jgi:hypothetical protein